MEGEHNRQDFQKRSDILLLIQARLNGQPGSNADRTKRLELSEQTISNLMKGNVKGLSLDKLIDIARKAGVTARL